MSEFKFSCPNCGQHLAATEDWSGKQIECPACQKPLTVPAAPAAVPVVRMASAPAAPVAASVAPPPPPPPAPSMRMASTPPPPPAPAIKPRPEAAGTGGKRSGMALASLCLGVGAMLLMLLSVPLMVIVIGFFVGLVGIALAITSVVLGHVSLSRIKSGRAFGGKGMAVTGLVLGYLCVAGAISMAVMVMVFYGRVKRQIAMNPPPGFTMKADGRAARPGRPGMAMTPESAEPKVTTEPDSVSIPDAPIAGTVRGRTFACDRAVLQNGILELRHGDDSADGETVLLFLFAKPGETLAGKKYLISASSSQGTKPHVHLRWQGGADTGSSAQMDNYCLRLEFGQQNAGKLDGRIYLELSESRQTKFAGTFRAALN